MSMIVVVNTKGGGGKSTTAMHLLAPWVLSRTGSSKIIEIDDQNIEGSDFKRSDVEIERFSMGEDAVSYFSAEKVVERSYAEQLIIDVGGNRTCDTFLKGIGNAGADKDIDLVVVPISSGGTDVENAFNTIDLIKEFLPDYTGEIVLVITRALSTDPEYVGRDMPDAFDLIESGGLKGPIILPHSRVFSGARDLKLTAWEVGDRFEALKGDIEREKAQAKKNRDMKAARLLSRVNMIVMEGRRWHDYLNQQFEILDGILPIGEAPESDAVADAEPANDANSEQTE